MERPEQASNAGCSGGVLSQTTFTRTVDWNGDESVTTAIVEAVAAVVGTEPTAMDPIQGVVDVDALERLFAPSGETIRGSGVLQFEYAGCVVEVGSNGTIGVVPGPETE